MREVNKKPVYVFKSINTKQAT